MFNRLSRARRVIENAFDILASRFRLIRRPINNIPENVKHIVKAAVALHNFLLNDNGYYTTDLVDTDTRPGDWREEIRGCVGLIDLPRVGANNYSNYSKEVRDSFMDYFNSAQGAVSWQTDYIQMTEDIFDREN